MQRNIPLIAGLLGLFSITASAQTFTEILKEGDPVPGAASGELIERIDNVDINNNGDWLVELNGNGDSLSDQYMLLNGVIIWQEGTTLGFTAPAGKEAGSYVDVMDINDNGDVLFITALRNIGTTSTAGFLAVRNGVTLIEADVTPCNAASLPAASFYSSISEIWQNNNGQLLVIGGVNLGATGNEKAIILRIDVDMVGNIISETKLALVGETLPGPNHVTPVQGFSTSKGRQAINDNGECMWYVDDDHTVAPGSTLSDSNMYMTDGMLNSTLLYNEAGAFPTDLADVFDHFSTAEVDLNNNGDFVFSGFDRGPSADDSWIFKSIGGVITTIAHEGDAVPASIPGPWLVAGFGFGGVVPMSNDGDVLWYIDWDDPDTSIDSALMFNDSVIMHEGVSVLSGMLVDDVPNSDSEVAMSDDGTIAIVEVVIGSSIDAVYIVEIESFVGNSYCGPAVVNSSGNPGTIRAMGSAAVANNDLMLVASDLPLSQFGFFLNSMTQGLINHPGGSQGNLCIVGSLGRYNAQIFNSGASGTGSITLDLSQTPTPTGPVSIMIGDTWNFQCWYRDLNPTPVSNFTDAVSVLFN